MNHGFCPICGKVWVSQSGKCLNCGFEIDSDYDPYLDGIEGCPDNWEDDWGFSNDALDEGIGSEYA